MGVQNDRFQEKSFKNICKTWQNRPTSPKMFQNHSKRSNAFRNLSKAFKAFPISSALSLLHSNATSLGPINSLKASSVEHTMGSPLILKDVLTKIGQLVISLNFETDWTNLMVDFLKMSNIKFGQSGFAQFTKVKDKCIAKIWIL